MKNTVHKVNFNELGFELVESDQFIEGSIMVEEY